MEKSEIQIIVGKRIKELRMQKGITQVELVGRMRGEIDPTNISRMESGNTNITIYQLYRLSEGLEIPMKDFLDFELPKE
ncbi:helix-turn-helix domain-containing protein [Chryseobacterium rhizosphaerae]|uniref:helix-turn-helix domain-containing protein n=1 Tax=Chryseobacterium rhizosphaerae TaxID=395937 RepID=UPI0023597A48|nr:helix-turn-helix transcriptional regulator [Chryseobacterium rhizosphaerae]MDC8102609.1 helix-turn-helix domain-containing protein [Chryseobacterium rhizosphaerae]